MISTAGTREGYTEARSPELHLGLHMGGRDQSIYAIAYFRTRSNIGRWIRSRRAGSKTRILIWEAGIQQ